MVLLLVDGECGFCMRAAAWLDARTSGVTLAVLQRADVSQYSLEPTAVAARLHAVGPNGVKVGSAAVAEGLRHGSRPMRFAASLIDAPVVCIVAQRVYELVAKFRHRLPSGTVECRLP